VTAVTITTTLTTTILRIINGSHVFRKPPILGKIAEKKASK
jgi:hypothetical protein